MKQMIGRMLVGIGILIAGGSFGLCAATIGGQVDLGDFDVTVFFIPFAIGICLMLYGAYGSAFDEDDHGDGL